MKDDSNIKNPIKKLTARQKAFCEYYVGCGNSVMAAKKAGYSDLYARNRTYNLFNKVQISNYIEKLRAEVKTDRIMDAISLQEFLTKVINGEIKDEAIVAQKDEKGNMVPVRVVKSVSIRDRLKSAELLAKLRGYDRKENENTDIKPILIIDELEE